MSKFHINKHGVPAPCKAAKGNCPLGDMDTHFDSIEDAQVYIDNQNESEHGLLPGMIEENQVDNDSKIELVYKESEGRFSYDMHAWYVNKMMENPSELAINLEEEHRVKINDIDTKTDDEKKILVANVFDLSKRKSGNIVGFLNSNSNTSYSKTKEYSKDNLEGNYEEIYPKLAILTKVGWHKSSGQGRSAENTAFNTILDKKGLNIASDILRTSEANAEKGDYPTSGMVASIQALRLKGWNEKDIKKASKTQRLDEVVYNEYKVKPREISGATEIIRIMNNDLGEYESLDEKLIKVLKWDK